MTKEEIIKQLHSAKEEFTGFCSVIDDHKFFHQPKEKWSIAQNVNHLTISANTNKIGFFITKIHCPVVCRKTKPAFPYL